MKQGFASLIGLIIAAIIFAIVIAIMAKSLSRDYLFQKKSLDTTRNQNPQSVPALIDNAQDVVNQYQQKGLQNQQIEPE